jgi:hypothetical protein
MPRLGKTHIGISSDAAAINAPYVSGPCQAFENGTINSISLYVLTTGVDVQFGVYLLGERSALVGHWE